MAFGHLMKREVAAISEHLSILDAVKLYSLGSALAQTSVMPRSFEKTTFLRRTAFAAKMTESPFLYRFRKNFSDVVFSFSFL